MSDATSASTSPLRWLSVVLIPFAIASLYLWLSRWPARWFTASSDYVALAVAVAAFGASVLALPLKRKRKIQIAIFGAPFLAAVLTLFSLVFVGFAFGDWL